MPLFNASFYDFNIHPSDSSLAELALEAKRLGYAGIAIIDSTITKEALPENFSIYRGIEISGRPSGIRDEIKKLRNNEILIAVGGDEAFNRAAVEKEGIDILLQPLQFNHIIAKAALENSVAIGFNLGSLIRLRGEARVKELNIMRTNLKHARKYRLAMILTSNAHSIYNLRSPREMAALASLFGMTPKEAVEAMSKAPLEILRRKSPDYIQEGVEII